MPQGSITKPNEETSMFAICINEINIATSAVTQITLKYVRDKKVNIFASHVPFDQL